MDPHNGGGGTGPQVLSPEAAAILAEGISLVMSRWTALQMAVENQWGGRESRSKADQLVASIQSWFIHPKPPLYIDDLEDIMYVAMNESLNTLIEDASIEEIAEQLMIMHEDCLKGDYTSIQKLQQQSARPTNAVSQSKQVGNDADEESSDEEGSESDSMDTEATQEMDVDPSKTNTKPVPDPDGWTVVVNKRNKGRRSN